MRLSLDRCFRVGLVLKMNTTLSLVVFATFFLFSGTLAKSLNQGTMKNLIFYRNTFLKGFFGSLDGCNCTVDGSNATMGCDAAGQCHCNCLVQGLKCDECVDNYFGFPNCEDNCKYTELG